MNVNFILPYSVFSLICSILLLLLLLHLLPIFSYFSLIPCPLFSPHCPLSFSFLSNYIFFSFPFASLSPPLLLVSFVLHHLFSLLISFLCITLVFPFSLYVFLSHFQCTPTSTSSDLLSLSIVMPVLVIPMDIFVPIFKFAVSEGKKDVVLALPAFAHN